jgi:hypothetical protein
MEMNVKIAVQLLKRHNKWRRGDEKIMMVNPETLGKAIDSVVNELENHGVSHHVSGIISDIEKLPRFDDNAWEEGGNTSREYDSDGGCVDADKLYEILDTYR